MTKIKICGITNIEDAKAAIRYGADALGFVFSESPRRITPEDAAEIVHSIPPFVTIAGIFVSEEENNVKDIIAECRLDLLQFHGSEPPGYCYKFKPLKKIVKSFRIKDKLDKKLLKDYADVDAFLFDTYSPEKEGGTGERFNWDILDSGLDASVPFILAGGLSPDNVQEAIQRVRPYAVDVSSGVESEPGRKDPNLMKSFMQAVRNAG